MSEFRFKFRHCYSELVEKILYNYDRKRTDVPDHAFLYQSEDRAVCLMCSKEIAVPLNDANIREHLKSEVHSNNVKTGAFDSFHDAFLKFDEVHQHLQMYFTPYSSSRFFCCSCKQVVLIEHILTHADSPDHKIQAVNYWPHHTFVKQVDYSKFSTDATPEHSKELASVESVDYSKFRPKDVSPKRLKKSSVESVDYSKFSPKDVTPKRLKESAFFESVDYSKDVTPKRLKESAFFESVDYSKDVTPKRLKESAFFESVDYSKDVTPKRLKESAFFESVDYSKDVTPKRLKKSAFVDSVDYSKLTLKDVAPQHLKELDFVDSPLTVQRIGTLNVCLLCQRLNVGPLEVHFESSAHMSFASNPDTFRLLSVFHQFWLKQPEGFQSRRKFFVPLGLRLVRCLVCVRRIHYIHIVEHVRDRCVLRNPQLTEIDVYPIKGSDVRMGYKPDINLTFYPSELVELVCEKDGLRMYTIQRQLEDSHCLLCQCVLYGVMTRAEILAHVTSSEHKEMLDSRERIDALIAYHEFWMEHRTITLQAKQMYFFPLDGSQASCWKCGTGFKFGEILSHLKEECSDSNISNSNSIDTTQINQQKHDNPSLSTHSTDYNKIEERGTKNNITKTIDVEIEVEKTNCVDGPDPNCAFKIDSYSSKTASHLYRMYVKSSNVRPTSYCIQIRSKNETYCLLCKKQVLGLLAVHLEAKRHLKLCVNEVAVQTLEQYHNYWMRQPTDKQSFQVRFNPHDSQSMVCVCCNQQVPTNQVMNHPCLMIDNVYHNYQVPEKYRNFKRKYNTAIFTKFCSVQFREIDKQIFNTKIPLCVQYARSVYCLLCGIKLYKCPKSWHKHLLDHAGDMEAVRNALPFVVQYHQFWQLQLPCYQIFMIHYVPDLKGSLRCVKRYVVSYEEAFEHTEDCPVDDLDSLRRLLEGISSMSALDSPLQSPVKIKEGDSSEESEDSADEEYSKSSSSNVGEGSKTGENEDDDDEWESYESSDSADDDDLNNKESGNVQNCPSPEPNDERTLVGELRKLDINTGGQKNTENGSELNKESSEQENSKLIANNEEEKEEIESECEATADKNEERILEYDMDTIYAVYPNYNNTNRSRRPTTYFMQKRSNIERYCLICNKRIIGIPVDHARGKKHSQNFENGSILRLLESYHHFWMALPPQQQLLQISFNPYSFSAFKCDVCKEPVPLAGVLNHPCLSKNNKYEAYEVSEEYRKFEIDYSGKVGRKLMSRIYAEITKSILNTEIPLALHFGNKAVCLLCGKHFFRETGLWHSHLLGHCDDLAGLQRRLAYVLQYHEFWEKEVPALQIFMMHYSPDFRGAMRCAKNHLVFYEDAFKHVTKCPVADWKKLMKLSEDNATDYNAEGVELTPVAARVQRQSEQSDSPSVNSNVSEVDDEEVQGEEEEEEQEDNDDDEESDGGIEFSESADNEGTSKAKENPKLTPVLTPAEKKILKKIEKSGKKVKKIHEVIPSIEDPLSADHFDLIPYRHQFQIGNFEVTDDTVHCKPCDVDFANTLLDIMGHIINLKHHRKTDKLKRRYHCDVCLRHCNNERKWISHVSTQQHRLLCDRRVKTAPSALQEYECLTCNAVFIGDEKSVKAHENQWRVKTKPAITLRPEVFELFKDENSTQKRALELREEILKHEEKDAQLVHDCLRGFESALKKTYPDCKAYPFGSRMTGIGFSNSDLDVFVDMGDMYFDNRRQKIQQEIVLKVKKILMDNRKSFSDIMAITHARTPIIRVVHIQTNIDCDLSFRHGLSVENTRFIKFCFDIQPVTRLAMLILKKWADIVSLKDEITSYALCMMFIFYMQTNGYLLSVCKLRRLTSEDVPTIDGWKIVRLGSNSPQDLKQHVKNYESTVFELLRGFFRMYSEFDFAHQVVCPLLGKPILVKQFENNGATLPAEMSTFVSRTKIDLDCKFKISAMCVQDPFDLAHNLTKAIFKSYREKFSSLCFLTYAHMKSVT